jgi:hypothetical protein
VAVSDNDVATLTTSYDCKQPGCTKEARSPVGRYSYCDYHRSQREAQQERTGVPASLARKPAKGSTFAEKVTELQRAAKLADRAKAAAVKATALALEAKNEADARERAFRELARELMAEREDA